MNKPEFPNDFDSLKESSLLLDLLKREMVDKLVDHAVKTAMPMIRQTAEDAINSLGPVLRGRYDVMRGDFITQLVILDPEKVKK